MTALPVGSRCAVYIKSIIPERMKVKLVIVDCQSPNGTAAGFAPPRILCLRAPAVSICGSNSPPQAAAHKTLPAITAERRFSSRVDAALRAEESAAVSQTNFIAVRFQLRRARQNIARALIARSRSAMATRRSTLSRC